MGEALTTKAVVTVSDMARMVGLSRARFYQLIGAGTFPPPSYDLRTRRPVYVEEQQAVCLEVRRRNCGLDGRPVLFYAKGHSLAPQIRPARPSKPKATQITDHADLLDGLASLGLSPVTTGQVEAALRSLYPKGTDGIDRGEVLRAVFLCIKRQNQADKVR